MSILHASHIFVIYDFIKFTFQCLNVLVQHGTTPDYNTENDRKPNCSCTKKNEQLKRVT